MRLLVNNAWSGSCVFNTRSGTPGAYIDRCVQLHDDTGSNAGEEPDIIAIYLGTNDQNNAPGSLGTFDAIDFDTLITVSDGVYSYKTPTTTLEAYAISLHKIGQRYPDAEVYCMTLLPRLNSSSQPTAFNEDLRLGELLLCPLPAGRAAVSHSGNGDIGAAALRNALHMAGADVANADDTKLQHNETSSNDQMVARISLSACTAAWNAVRLSG